jgi:hypothetical protein
MSSKMCAARVEKRRVCYGMSISHVAAPGLVPTLPALRDREIVGETRIVTCDPFTSLVMLVESTYAGTRQDVQQQKLSKTIFMKTLCFVNLCCMYV